MGFWDDLAARSPVQFSSDGVKLVNPVNGDTLADFNARDAASHFTAVVEKWIGDIASAAGSMLGRMILFVKDGLGGVLTRSLASVWTALRKIVRGE